MKPNILFLMTDQMRGDCLGIAGHPDVKTPYLDTLAARGHYFPNAYTACPSCIAARSVLWTGKSPAHTGRVGYKDGVSWDYDNTLAEILGKAGYTTQCVGKMHVHPLRNRLGFENVLLHDGYLGYYRRSQTPYYEHQAVADDYFYWLKTELGSAADITDTGLECNSWVARPWPYEEKYHPTNWVTSNAIDFLRKRDRSKPFFLTASYVRPHPPFDAPACYFDLYRDRALTPPPVGEWAAPYASDYAGRSYDGADGIADPELLRQAQIGYYACITHLDHQIGRLLQALGQDGQMENTIILFASDHGELLGDHHTFRKTRPYQGSIRIPLIFSAPESLLPKRGIRHTAVAGLEDILPTLAEWAGAPLPSDLDGHSLLPLLKGSGSPVRPYLHGEHSGGDLGNQFIVTETDKFCWYMESGAEEYFDLASDPQECRNRISDPACQERILQLRSWLIAELEGREEGYTDGTRLIPGRPQQAVLNHCPPSQHRKKADNP